jgi:glycosyltransferase involved in cell wall biosynthesis
MIEKGNYHPLVSVYCAAYNQANYITQAIEGFLMQKTSFPLEIINHDDVSTDKTTQIVRQYAGKFQGLIVPIYQTENQYSKRGVNILSQFVLPKERGKYIALFDGEYYWKDSYQLQKQMDFL